MKGPSTRLCSSAAWINTGVFWSAHLSVVNPACFNTPCGKATPDKPAISLFFPSLAAPKRLLNSLNRRPCSSIFCDCPSPSNTRRYIPIFHSVKYLTPYLATGIHGLFGCRGLTETFPCMPYMLVLVLFQIHRIGVCAAARTAARGASFTPLVSSVSSSALFKSPSPRCRMAKWAPSRLGPLRLQSFAGCGTGAGRLDRT
jgi:hypothetical protein